MLLLLLNHVVLRALWKIDEHVIRTLVNKSLLLLLLLSLLLLLLLLDKSFENSCQVISFIKQLFLTENL